MFRFVTSLAQSASEYLAPNLKPEEELFLQWHNLVKELKSRNGSMVSVDDTDIPLKLQWVFNLIHQELASSGQQAPLSSSEIPSSSHAHSIGIGQCLEIALRYKIFDWLVALAKTDKPSGIRGYVLFFITSFLKSPNISAFLPKSFIYKPISRLVSFCGSSSCSPFDKDELEFFRTLVDLLQQDPCLVNLFLKSNIRDPTEDPDVDMFAITIPDNPFLADLQQVEAQGSTGGSSGFPEFFTFPLIDSLLRLSVNPDPDISLHGRAAVIAVLKLREPVVCKTIAASPTFASMFTRRFRKLYVDIVVSADNTAAVAIPNASEATEDLVRSFLLWASFVDAIFSVAEETAGERLCVALQQDLHHSNGFSEDWLSATKEKNLKAMAIFLRLFKLVESQAFLGLLGSVFMEQEFFDRFLQFTKDNDTCLMAFDVLDGIIQKPLFQLIDAFFLQYLGTRLYIRKDQRMHESKKDVKVTEATDRAAMFSDLFPVPAKSCTAVEEKRDCENYIRESNYAMGAFRQRCQHLQWPADGPLKPCNILLAEESAFFDGQAFNEGPLLRILFDRLLALFEQPYILNLRVTGILSKVCLLPHPVIREYFLDPTVPLSSQCNSLYRSMINLVQKMDGYAERTRDFRERLLTMRQNIKNGQWADASKDPANTVASAVVTLEEFCKEIAARAFVTYDNPVIV